MQPLALEQLTVAALAQAPDIIAVTGDLVHLALADEIDVARRWLDRLADHARVILVPGNHDCYQADSCAPMQQSWNTHLGLDTPGDFPSVHVQDGVTFFGLSSARPMPFWSAAGEIGQAQLARLDAALTSASSGLRCVLLHHPPIAGIASRRKALRDAGTLGAMLERHGVELVLHGHLHSNRESRLGARTRVLATAAASNTSARSPASFRVLEVRASPHGWTVQASLHVRDPASATVAVMQNERWQFAPIRTLGQL